MRIVSFLPSATEMLWALGLGEQVVAVTFECDHPAAAMDKPRVVHSHMPPGLTPAEIDQLVRSTGGEGRSLYFADLRLLEELAPDLILLQDLCKVCAIDSPTLARDLSCLKSHPKTLSLSAHTLHGVLEDIYRVGEATGAQLAAEALVGELRSRFEAVAARAALQTRPKVLALEWLDPFFQGGHWVPEMIDLAGGEAVLANPGAKSVRLTWEQVRLADPEVLVIMPCGYHLQETVAQYRAQTFPSGWSDLQAVRRGKVYAVDGSAYFSRPGPRLVDGVEILAKLLREEAGEYLRL